MGAIEPIHILIVLIVVFLLFGAKRLPELGRSLGSGIHEFKKSTQELHGSMDADAEEAPRPQVLISAQAESQPGVQAASATDGVPAGHAS
jgi:sec-independent protein translocase protein TatA